MPGSGDHVHMASTAAALEEGDAPMVVVRPADFGLSSHMGTRFGCPELLISSIASSTRGAFDQECRRIIVQVHTQENQG